MAFTSISEFLCMPGVGATSCHGLYVWLSYGIAAAVVLFNILSPKYMRKKLIADVKRRERRENVQ